MKLSTIAWWRINKFSTNKSYIWYDGSMTTATDGTRQLLDLAPKGGRNNISLTDGQMLDFDGVADYVPIDIETLNLHTIVFDIYLDSTTKYVLGRDDGAWSAYLSISTTHARIKLYPATINFYYILSTGYYSFTITINNEYTEATLYANGVRIAHTNLYDFSFIGYNFTVLGRHNNNYFSGSIGNVQFWNKVFIPQQISYSFNNPEKALYIENYIIKSDNPDIDVADCVSWIPLTEGESSYVRDMVSYGEGLSIIGNNITTDSGSSYVDGIATLVQNDGNDFIDLDCVGISGEYYLVEYLTTYYNGNYTNKLWLTASDVDEWCTTSIGINKIVILCTNANPIQFKLRNINNGEKIEFTNISVKQLSGTIQIPHTSPDTVAWSRGFGSSKGIQTTAIKRDSLGELIGLADGYDLHGQIPALPIDMTDTDLGSKFVIEFVIEREILVKSTYLFYTYGNGTKGLILYTSTTGDNDRIKLYLYDGSGSVSIQAIVNDSKHYIAFIVNETSFSMAVDGVEGTAKDHSFLPSGLNFKDSTQPSPIGSLPYFKIWTEAEFDNFDLAKAYANAQKYL